MASPELSRGEVWLIDLGTPLEHEQGFVRPAVVVSHSVLNRCAATSSSSCRQPAPGGGCPVTVEIEAGTDTGLTRRMLAL